MLELFTGAGLSAKGARVVTINRRGTCYIAAVLGKNLTADKPNIEIEYDRDLKMMRLTPVVEISRGTRRWQKSNKKRGDDAKFSCATALRYWGIMPNENVYCEAEWIGESLHVYLSQNGDSAKPEPKPVRKSEGRGRRTGEKKKRCLGCISCGTVCDDFHRCKNKENPWGDGIIPVRSCCEKHKARRPGMVETEQVAEVEE